MDALWVLKPGPEIDGRAQEHVVVSATYEGDDGRVDRNPRHGSRPGPGPLQEHGQQLLVDAGYPAAAASLDPAMLASALEAVQAHMEKEGDLVALRSRIREDKTLDLLKANARMEFE